MSLFEICPFILKASRAKKGKLKTKNKNLCFLLGLLVGQRRINDDSYFAYERSIFLNLNMVHICWVLVR